MWYVPENRDPFYTEEPAVEAALEVAKQRNETVNIHYLNYDAEGSGDTVVWAHPCGCAENTPHYRRLRHYIVQCDEHKENND